MKTLFRVIVMFLFIWLLYTGNPDMRDFNEYISGSYKKNNQKLTGQEAVDDFLSSIGGKAAEWASAGSYERKNYILFSFFSSNTAETPYLGIGNTFFKFSGDKIPKKE